MVGRLSLQDVPELVDTKKKGDGVLDSPDSGMPPPSPSTSHWGLAPAGGGSGGERTPAPGALEPDAAATPAAPSPASPPSQASSCLPRLRTLSFGEGVEFDPLPPMEVRYTSSVKYGSERHFIDDVHLPLGLVVTSCSQTVTCIPNCTWRSYKTEVRFEPRHKPTRFLSTTIVYPKYPKTVYTTTLDYNCQKTLRRFLSSVELEASEFLGSDDLSDEC
ncbi:LOW QUALITY PROTEIN: refilin-B [Choloepus didactylus]|uniref:LOW QUALITY PROTEIN: refilin-B n=1 Tax=Choloepus didactylus TaxID=27675 RepID=UPI00189CE72D|nr:LOW QUALITY PROTEIN: refilin-B [Choloepus didactylus]